jgi:hypothetical protein
VTAQDPNAEDMKVNVRATIAPARLYFDRAIRDGKSQKSATLLRGCCITNGFDLAFSDKKKYWCSSSRRP